MQTDPLARRTVEHCEDLADTFEAIASDGVITPEEVAETRTRIRLVYVAAMETDDAQAAGIALMRTGVNGYRTRKLVRQMMDGPSAA